MLMSTTTLRAYLDELDLLLQREALEEVIGHCRHILQHYPKNVETYRLLGKALLEKARHEEAAQVFPRLLSADPNDFVAHVGMSSIYENQQQLNQAVWHMERANEQMPNNNVILNELKRLYKRRDEASPRKIQLTRAALAQQYLNSGMHEQAITELRRSLVEQPNRLDLRVRLATALWDAGHLLEAGELALEVLRVLPDCLPLNLLMAKLWIETRRPDDAKPFLEKVEALAPYESLRLIYSSENQATLPEGAFVLSRLKWTADAATSVAGPAPDWISQITDVFNTPESIAPTRSPGRSTAQEMPDWMSEAVSPTPADDLPDWFTPGADFGGKPKTADLPAPDDWFNEMASSLSQPSPAKASLPPTPAPAVSGEDELPDWFADVAETAPTVNASDLFGDTTAEAPLPDWMTESPSQKPEAVAPTPSWLDDIPDFTTTESAPPARKSTGFTGLLAEIQQAEDEELPGWSSEEPQFAADNEPPSIFGDVEEFSFGENPDEELEQLRAAARPPSAEEVAALLAMGGRKPEEAEDALPDWLVEESPTPAANEPSQTLWDEETLFEDFGAVEAPTSMPAGTPSWLSDAPDLSEGEDQAEFTTLFEDETPDWLTDVPAQSAASISGTDMLPEIAAQEEPTFSFETDDWLMGETESTEASATSPIFQLDEESPATGDEIDWLTDAVATDTPSLTLEKVEQESAEEFASLFEDELVTPPPAAEQRLGVTGDLPWRQGTSEASAETGSIDEFAVLFDSQLPQQPSISTPSRLGVTGDLPWRQDTDSDVFASPGRASSLDEVDWNVLESEAMSELPVSAEPLETASEQTPVDDLAAWLNVPPQTSSIAQDVSDEEFTDLFSDDLIPGTAWLDDVQQAAVPDMPDFLAVDENEEVPEWMRGIEPIQSVAPEVTDSELDAMFSTPVDEFSAIGEPSTGWLTELDNAPANDWASSLETPSAKLDVSDADFDKMFGTPADDLSAIGEPSTGWLTELDSAPADDWASSLETPSAKLDVSDADFDKMFGAPVDDLAAVDKPSTGWLTDFESPTAGATVDLSEEISDDWLLSMPSALSNTLGTEVSDDDLSRLLGDDFGEVRVPSSQSFESAFDDLSDISTPSTGWLDDLEEGTAQPESAADWLSSFGQIEPPAPIPQTPEHEFGSLFDDLSEIEAPRTGWLDDLEEGTAKPESASDWLSSFGQAEPPEAIPQTSQPEFGSLFDDLSEIEAPRTGWLDDLEEGTAEPESAADWLSSFGQTEPPEAIPQAAQIPDWLSGDFDDNEAIEPQVTAKSDMDTLFGDLSEIGEPHTGWLEDVESEIAEPESAADWLSSIGKSEPSAPIPMTEPAAALPDWLAGVEIEEEPETPVAGFDDLFQDMSVVAEERTDWLDLDEQELEESTEAGMAAEWQDDLLLEESEVESAVAPDWLSDDIRLDTSDIQMAVDFDERPARASARESEERKPVDNIDVFLASITSADQNRIPDQTEAMISELDQLTGFKLRELKPEEVEAATRPSSPVPTTLPEEFPDEADFGFDKAEVTPVAPKRDLPDTNMEFDDAFPMQWDEPAKPKQKRGRRLFGKRREPTAEVEPEAIPVATPASFDFDHDPPWLRRQKGAAPSIGFDESADFNESDFGEDDDTPPDWFK
ncbi:MAG: hypothetical protein DPW16_21010 [Chloroflexi bacterium]|nr:hypothetical protein [Chloroflexota bacterium]